MRSDSAMRSGGAESNPPPRPDNSLFLTDKATKRIRQREKTEEQKAEYCHMKKNISYKEYEIMQIVIYSIRKIISIKNY